jgi:hypothetical protein
MTRTPPNLICLSGWKGSGKDEIARILVEEFGYKRLAMADRLKDEVARMYRLPRQHLDDRVLKETPLTQYPVRGTDGFSAEIHRLLRDELASGHWTPRALCILEGSTRRAVDPSAWVRALLAEIEASPEARFVVADMRYRSEAALMAAAAVGRVELWRVERLDAITTTDPSERDLDSYGGFDLRVQNRGTLTDLAATVRVALARGE